MTDTSTPAAAPAGVPPVTLYASNGDVAAYRPRPYPKRRPSRSAAGTVTALRPTPAARPQQAPSDPTYAEFIAGDFSVDAQAELLQA
jgi:hypothetical protein